jgi:hypothetical protein
VGAETKGSRVGQHCIPTLVKERRAASLAVNLPLYKVSALHVFSTGLTYFAGDVMPFQSNFVGNRRRHKVHAVATLVACHPDRGLWPYNGPLERCTMKYLTTPAMAQLGVACPQPAISPSSPDSRTVCPLTRVSSKFKLDCWKHTQFVSGIYVQRG